MHLRGRQLGGVVAGLMVLLVQAMAWAQVRSSLYPADWKPGLVDSAGRYLHDFSYAGYHKSEVPLPRIDGKTVDVTAAPYNADRTGADDASGAIQKALDDVGKSGGGVVYLPAGTYRLKFGPKADSAICVRHSNVVLRGDGMERTRLFCDETVSRDKSVVLVRPDGLPWWGWWFYETATVSKVTQDLLMPSTSVPLADTKGFAAGDLVIVRADCTQEFIDELGMTGKWKVGGQDLRGVTLVRRVVAVDSLRRTLTIDTPTRYPMKVRDMLRVYKLADSMVRESGLEGFAVGMRQNRTPGVEDGDFTKAATGGYEMQGSCAVTFSLAEDCWARGIGTYHPEGNDPSVHIHSNGVRLNYCRQVTVAECVLQNPQYLGGGGNGYLYTTNGNDNLFRDCVAVRGRHNFDLWAFSCVGNVFYNCTGRGGRLASDFHMYFSTANLFDNMTLEGEFLECVYRPYGGPMVHGVTGSQNVFWNTNGLAYGKRKWLVQGKQFGFGYVIGTRGPASAVSPDTTDFTELVGKGDELQPRSLWRDQLRRRLGGEGERR